MPLARGVHQRGTTNENDENAPTATRLTRAKTVLSDAQAPTTAAAKKPLTTKKAASNTTGAGAQRKRPALGDVSNVTKTETAGGNGAKKPATVKAGLTSKTTAQAGGVQKLSRTNSSRSALGVKDNNTKKSTAEAKRPGSGSGVVGSTQVKRTSSQKSIKKETVPPEHSEQPPRKKIELEKKSATEAHSTATEDGEPEPDTIKGVPNDTIPDLDTQDLDDPLMAAEYVVEIFDYLRELELDTVPNPDYIDHQPELEWEMRDILVNWLIEVHTRFRLLPETLFLAVNIMDRFLSAEVVALERLQLVGTTAIFIASKYEETLAPHVTNFRRVTDNTFSDEEILEAERHVLAALDYNLSYPNPIHFLRRISKADSYNMETRTLAKYLTEISLVDHRFMEYRQSLVAAAAMYLARAILGRGPWNPTLSHYSGYTEEEIIPVFELMIDYLHKPVAHEHQAFFRKYASKRFIKASIVTRQWAKRYHALQMETLRAEKRTTPDDS